MTLRSSGASLRIHPLTPLGGHENNPLVSYSHKVIEPGTVTTWVNHWSLMNAHLDSLKKVDRIGVDGTLLQLIARISGWEVARTSADLVIPHVIARHLPPDSRIALIGAAPGVGEKAAERFTSCSTMVIDGYEGLVRLREDPTPLVEFDPRLVLLGLGAGLQEDVAVELRGVLPDAAICTAGGWIDQLAAAECYFPAWVHHLRLGWAWRIAHEPRRLIRRYTVDAARFLVNAPRLIRMLRVLGETTSLDIEVRR